jgi:hypothetical protein
MSTPGAVMSGLIAPSRRGPRLEKLASASDLLTAPTASASSALAGVPIVPVPGTLPAATTKSVPCSAVREPTASSTGSMPGVSGAPRLRFTTFAPWSAAHCMPARIHDSAQPPTTHTLPSSRRAPGATPAVPATVAATWVPWPVRSLSSSLSWVKFW